MKQLPVSLWKLTPICSYVGNYIGGIYCYLLPSAVPNIPTLSTGAFVSIAQSQDCIKETDSSMCAHSSLMLKYLKVVHTLYLPSY